MDSLSVFLPSPPLQTHPKTTTLKPKLTSNLISLHPNLISRQTHLPQSLKTSHFLDNSVRFQLSSLLFSLSSASPSSASQTSVATQQGFDKINLESIVVSIDGFFSRYPFLVAGVTFVWLVVIPLSQEYFSKYKFVSAFNAFRKLKEDPKAQLLDIRDSKSVAFLGTPNLKILGKDTVQVHFSETDEDGFVKNVLERLSDPRNTSVCILDNFDGNSMKVAELLFKNGFKEAYAIRGGVRGKNGWLDIQETLLPPSVRVYRKKKKKKKVKMSQQLEMNGGITRQNDVENEASASLPGSESRTEPEFANNHIESSPQ